MLVDFTQLPRHARVWIYQANRTFSKQEADILSLTLSSFLSQWTAHGNELQAGVTLPYNQFVVVGLNEQAADASGCSIDSLFRVMQQLASQLDIDFFNREQVAFYTNGKVVLHSRSELKQMLALTGGQVLTFNNLVGTKEDWEANWIVPANTTWLKRYITQVSA